MSDFHRFLEHEEDFLSQDKKTGKKERKLASKQDRSKYKKSNVDQQRKKMGPVQFASKTSLQGQVLGIFPEGIQVLSHAILYRCQIKGSLKKEKTQNKNLVAVGDFVVIEPRGDREGLICQVEPRRSVLSRADNLSRRKEQLIAVNIDQVIITASAASPELKPFLLDRYIIAAKKGNMDPLIVINKMDLIIDDEEKTELVELCQQAYTSLGIPCFLISTKTNRGIDELKMAMEGKSSVFSGQSGVGKSSLINAVIGSSLKIGELTGKTDKGSHTTTSSYLIPIEGNGFCIDTPGIRSFGLWALTRQDIQQYFTEILEASALCRFPDCSHNQEPSCAVQKAVDEGFISPIRFASYLALIETLKEKHRTR